MAPLKDKSQKDNKHLLLVDDDPNLVLLVKDYLELKRSTQSLG